VIVAMKTQLVVLACAVACSAMAQAKKVEYEKKTTLDFEAASVDGQFQSPDGMAIQADKSVEFDSLIEPKKSFNKEMQRSMRGVR
jgi:hypothetical protein